LVSTGGGHQPIWSRSGDEIFYGLDGQIMAVPVSPSGGSFRVGKPHRATTQRYQTRGQNRMFDMSPDGRFALATAPPPADRKESGSVVLISNFSTELARAPAR
jgi:hypothetical protein